MTDRLEEIKQRWCEWIKIIRTTGTWVNMEKPSGVQDVEWLIAEVERLRGEQKQEEPGPKEWTARPGITNHVLVDFFGRDVSYIDDHPLAKAIATYLSARLNHMQGTVMECDVNNALSSLDDALRQFNAGEGA